MKSLQMIEIPLWPEGAPGAESWDQVEEEIRLSNGLPVVRNVTRPSLTVYPAKNPNGAAVIIAPGGAYHFLAIDHEGRQVAEWLNARGIAAFILKYRVMRTGPAIEKEVNDFMAMPGLKAAEMEKLLRMTLADANQAMRIVRQRAAEWEVDPTRVGFMGFSAGGGVTMQLVLNPDPGCRPDFAAPIYPAVFDAVQAPSDAPPLFLACTASDEMASRANLLLYSAWKASQRPVEMHIYAHGEHGFGMTKFNRPSDTWIERFYEWMKAIGVV